MSYDEDYMTDLQRLQDDYAKAQPASGGAELPDGTYQAEVTRAELKRSKKGNLMLSWTFRVLAPEEYAKRLIFHQNMLQTAENMGWLKKDLATAGVELPEITGLSGILNTLLGRVLEVKRETRGEFTNVYLQALLAKSVGEFAPEKVDTPF